MQAVSKDIFFNYVDKFMDYRTIVYETTDQTNKSNSIDINLFKNFVDMKKLQYIDGKTVMEFQFYLKKERLNSGASMNRKLFTLRSYGKYLKLENIPHVNTLPFYDVLKCRNGYNTQANALSKNQIKTLFEIIERKSLLGIRDYAVYVFLN